MTRELPGNWTMESSRMGKCLATRVQGNRSTSLEGGARKQRHILVARRLVVLARICGWNHRVIFFLSPTSKVLLSAICWSLNHTPLCSITLLCKMPQCFPIGKKNVYYLCNLFLTSELVVAWGNASQCLPQALTTLIYQYLAGSFHYLKPLSQTCPQGWGSHLCLVSILAENGKFKKQKKMWTISGLHKHSALEWKQEAKSFSTSLVFSNVSW